MDHLVGMYLRIAECDVEGETMTSSTTSVSMSYVGGAFRKEQKRKDTKTRHVSETESSTQEHLLMKSAAHKLNTRWKHDSVDEALLHQSKNEAPN